MCVSGHASPVVCTRAPVHTVLSLEDLLRDDAGETPQHVPTPVDDDNLQTRWGVGAGRVRNESFTQHTKREKETRARLKIIDTFFFRRVGIKPGRKGRRVGVYAPRATQLAIKDDGLRTLSILRAYNDLLLKQCVLKEGSRAAGRRVY